MAASDSVATTPDALRLVGTLLRLVRTVDQRFRAAGDASSLTLTELSVLGRIGRDVTLPSQIARTLRLDPARVTHVTDRLVSHGYVSRELDPDDRRCWRLRLTPEGDACLEQGRANARAAMETLLNGLSEDERADLYNGLEGARRVLDALHLEAQGAGKAT